MRSSWAVIAMLLMPAVSRSGELFLPAAVGPAERVIRSAQSPQWFRRTPALYIPTACSAGAGMLMFRGPLLPGRLRSFHDLPQLLDQARSLGTDTMYLVDYYEGWPGQRPIDYWLNKGDYVPRADFGGPEAFKEGVAAIHQQHGRVIVYVEAFIISKHSRVGQAHGQDWSILTPQGPLAEPYPGHWHLCPACPEWRAYIADVCRRLVREYGVDGVHLDSFGYQQNWRCVSTRHRHAPDKASVFNQGCVDLVRTVRDAMHAVNPESVILVEGPLLPALFEFADGSQDWGIHTLSRRAVWNAAGRTDIFATGWSLDDLHQILALGHKLSLGGYWLERPPGTSCVAALPAVRRKFEHEQARREYAEGSFGSLHQWRNAGLLLGLPMPEIDDVTPRRAQPIPAFRSDESLEALLTELRRRAAGIDAALGSKRDAGWPAPAEHLRALLQARTALSPIIDDGSKVTALDTGVASVAAYRFDSPAGCALSAVNVAGAPALVHLPLTRSLVGARFTDAVTGEVLLTAGARLDLAVPPHSVRMLRADRKAP